MTQSRDYYYELSERGVLSLDGVVQDDPWFLDFFFRRLATTANPDYPEHPFVSRCGDEMNYLKPADTPIVYTSFVDGKLVYANSLTTMFRPDRLAYSKEGVLYHAAPIGTWGRIVPPVAMELSKIIEPWGPLFCVNDAGRRRRVPLEPLDQRDRYTVLRPREENACVGCGEANPWSFELSFLHDKTNQTVQTFVVPDIRMQGSLGIVHGGFVSFLLDETMGKCFTVRGIKAPTGTLNVRFVQPMELGVEYEVRASHHQQNGRKHTVKAQINDWRNQTVVATAEALFIERKPIANAD